MLQPKKSLSKVKRKVNTSPIPSYANGGMIEDPKLKLAQTTGIGLDPSNINPAFNTKKIVKYQSGVMNDKLGSGFYLYNKLPTESGFNIEENREFIKQGNMMDVQRTPQWQDYMKQQAVNKIQQFANRSSTPSYANGGQMLQTAGGLASMVPGYGTVIGAGLGIVGGMMNVSAEEKLEEERRKQVMAQQKQQDVLALEDYNTQGYSGVQYYAKGGTLPNSASNGNPTIGGDLVPLDNNTELVVGNTHDEDTIDGQAGVTLMDESGKPQANVEDQEVIKDGEYVFSDRLKSSNGQTFANRIKNLTTKKVKIQDKVSTSRTNRHTDGYNRMVEGIELQEQQLQEEQEIVKMLQPNIDNMSTPQFKKGGFLPKYDEGGILPLKSYLKPVGYVNPLPTTNFNINVPYTPNTNPLGLEPETDNSFINNLAPSLIDNLGNAIINSRTPKLPAPILARAQNLDSTVNVNPQLSSVTGDVESTVRDIQSNTSNSNVARANMANVRLQGMKAKMGIYANKEAQERAIKNLNTQNQQNISNVNAGTMNEARNRDFVRANEIGARTSANLANLSSDISRARETTDTQTNVDEVMLLSLMDDKTGAKMRAMERNPYFAKNPKLRNALKSEVARRKALNPNIKS